MNKLDLYAVPDATDAEEAAFENVETIIDQLDGQALFESGVVDVEALFDAFGLPDVFAGLDREWDVMPLGEQRRWDALADVIKRFAFVRLDYDKTMEHADDIAA